LGPILGGMPGLIEFHVEETQNSPSPCEIEALPRLQNASTA
jgi:hypothetical protein